MVRISGDVRDPLFRAPRRRLGAPPTGCPLVQCQIATKERQRNGRLGAREDDVQRLDTECAAGTLHVVDDADGLGDALPVAERECCDHEPACEVDLVVEGTHERAPLPRARLGPRARACERGASWKTSSRTFDGTRSRPPAASSDSSAASTPARSRSSSAGSTIDTVRGRSGGGRAHERQTPRGFTGERRGYQGHCGRAQASHRRARRAREARLVEGGDDPAHELGVRGVRGDDRVERGGLHPEVGIHEEISEHSDVEARASTRGEQRRDSPTLGGRPR